MGKARTNPLVRFINTMVYNGLEGFNKYYSKYRAFVFNVDDPLKLGRLQLIIPHISGNDYYNYWAYPTNVFAGDGYGSQVLPRKGDVVWVEFEGGCAEVPIWSHGHFAKNEKPSKKDPELDDVQCYWFKTPNGNLVKLNDTKNTIHIKSSLGDVIEINPDSISLVTKKDISFGKLNKSTYHAVLGEEDKEALKQIQAYLEEFSLALNSDIIISIGSPYLKKTNLQTKGVPLLLKALKLKVQIEKILSDKVTLEK